MARASSGPSDRRRCRSSETDQRLRSEAAHYRSLRMAAARQCHVRSLGSWPFIANHRGGGGFRGGRSRSGRTASVLSRDQVPGAPQLLVTDLGAGLRRVIAHHRRVRGRLGQVLALGAVELQKHPVIEDLLDLVGVDEAMLGAEYELIDHDAVEDVLAIVRENVCNLAELVAVGAVPGGAA